MACVHVHFNSTVVRLKAVLLDLMANSCAYFNSTVVRLKVPDDQKIVGVTVFQFNCCAIKGL